MEAYARKIETVRHAEYPQLQATTYLDHAGTTLYAQSLVDAWSKDLKTHLFGNPHSASTSSTLSTLRVDRARKLILAYVNANPSEFDVVFTANATAAIKLVASCFQEHGFWFGYHKDSHTSLVGVRELASKGSRCFTSNFDFETWIHAITVKESDPLQLVAYPAQSNLTGARLPLRWCSEIRRQQRTNLVPVYTLLDAASFLTTGALDFVNAASAPDFTALSFYKIFGLPDLGALIVRKEAGHVLTRRRYFGGGTVDMVIAINDSWHAMHQGTFADVLEDGTLPFHNIVALEHAIAIQRNLYGSPSQISRYVTSLAFSMWQKLSSLRHYNRSPVVQIHQEDHSRFGDPSSQGPIIAFTIRDSLHRIIGKSRFEALAVACGIQLRTGGVCNPGGIATMLNLEPWELRRNFYYGLRCGNEVDLLAGKATGVIRVSLGPMSTEEDVNRFVGFTDFFFVEHVASSLPPKFRIQSRPRILDDTDGMHIVPIAGCAPSTIPVEAFASSESAQAIYATWHGEWCIFDLEARIRVTKDLSSFLKVSVSHQTGILTVQDATNSESGKADGPSRNILDVSMWDDDLRNTEQNPMGSVVIDGHAADLYSSEEVREFFTRALGSPSTLARFRPSGREWNIDQLVCPVQWCRQRFDASADLAAHHTHHAAQFEKSFSPLEHDGSSETAKTNQSDDKEPKGTRLERLRRQKISACVVM